MENNQQNQNNYLTGVWLTGIAVFALVWLYAMSQWGFLLGLVFGWIPALIAGAIGGILWPITILLAIGFFYLITRH